MCEIFSKKTLTNPCYCDIKIGPSCVCVNKKMWTLILLMGFLPVSGALWAEYYVKGILGRAITINCHYEDTYRSYTKYWCHGWTPLCSVLVETNGQHGRSGRVSITDNQKWRIFTVTIENLQSGDTGWYSCGISESGFDTRFNLHLQVSEAHVSDPVIRYLSPANVPCLGGSLRVSCESFQGSLPIQYRWYEQTSSGHSKISDTNELALHCQSFNHMHHQYYCRASNQLGARSSGMVEVTVFNNREICSYETEINGIKRSNFCENPVAESKKTVLREKPASPQIKAFPAGSDALREEKHVRGVVGRAVTIGCHYAPKYHSNTKYLCRKWGQQCTSLVNTTGTNKQHGRMTIQDNTTQGIFTVTMENLVSNDAGHYQCGIKTSGKHLTFDVNLQVSDEPVSVPAILYLPPANVSCVGGSVTVSCESVQGSLPIQYMWHENTLSVDSKISENSKLDLHCQSFTHQHHQYYCTASNSHGAKSSEIVNVSIYNRGDNCSFVTQFTGTGRKYSCETFTMASTASFMMWKVGRWLLFALLMISTISVTWFTKKAKRPEKIRSS